MKTVKRKTQPTLTRNVRQLTRLCASLIAERDALAKDVARLKGQAEPLPFLEQAQFYSTQRAPR